MAEVEQVLNLLENLSERPELLQTVVSRRKFLALTLSTMVAACARKEQPTPPLPTERLPIDQPTIAIATATAIADSVPTTAPTTPTTVALKDRLPYVNPETLNPTARAAIDYWINFFRKSSRTAPVNLKAVSPRYWIDSHPDFSRIPLPLKDPALTVWQKSYPERVGENIEVIFREDIRYPILNPFNQLSLTLMRQYAPNFNGNYCYMICDEGDVSIFETSQWALVERSLGNQKTIDFWVLVDILDLKSSSKRTRPPARVFGYQQLVEELAKDSRINNYNPRFFNSKGFNFTDSIAVESSLNWKEFANRLSEKGLEVAYR